MSAVPTTAAAIEPDALATRRYLAYAAFALGAIALLVAVPPFRVDTVAAPIVIAVVGFGFAVAAFRAGERELISPAAFVVSVGLVGGLLCERADSTTLKLVFTAGLFASMLAYATPLVLTGVGGLIAERSGVTNIGLEGMILMGAFAGYWGAVRSDHWFVGVLVGMLGSILMSAIHAVFSIHLRANQIVSGTAINILAVGLTGYAYRDLYGQSQPNAPQVPNVNLHSGRIPVIGGVIADLNLLTWVAILLVGVSWVFLFKTPWGLRLRAVGEHPRAADTVGIDVYRVRYLAVLTSGALAGVAGAYLSIAYNDSFGENMSNGRGFIALAAVIFGKWKPQGVFLACCLFGFASALGDALQTAAGIDSTLMAALPYIFTLVALVGLVGRSIPPASAGLPYKKQ
jgi:general nucleoside transport system permease protein